MINDKIRNQKSGALAIFSKGKLPRKDGQKASVLTDKH